MEKNYPGLKKRPRANGTVSYYWVASSVSKDAHDFPLKTVRLHGDEDEMGARCRALTAELREWLSERGRGTQPLFDGTIKSLIAVYRKTPESPYHAIKHNTRVMYDESLDLLEEGVGHIHLQKLKGITFKQWYNEMKEPAAAGKPERVRRAYKAMQLLRIIIKFGVVADIEDCVRLAIVLENMEFSAPPARKQHITYEQVKAICECAIKAGRTSIAIAQVLQFELTLRQVDVIGLWEPLKDTDTVDGIISRQQRWSGGLSWSHIDSDGILKKITTKTGQEAEHDTMAYPYLREMLNLIPLSKRIGPIIIDESSGLPYRQRNFISIWRKIANECGIPKDVWNRDSRAGGVTEGSDAGANIEHLRHHANHSNIATTIKYDRKTVSKTREVAELRIAHRAKNQDTH